MNSTARPAIETHGLAKLFGATQALAGIDLTVPAGTVFGFLGPNGAGKTTAIRILSTLLRPDGGSARVFGHDVVSEAAAVRDRISLTGQFASTDDDLTARENLVLLARLLGHSRRRARSRADELLTAFSLSEAASRLVKNFSGGMRRRLDIAASIIVTPDLLFLDEPTTGLDPRNRGHVWDMVRAIVAAGTTVMLTTQYLDEADQLADRIAVIDRGAIIAEGTSGELKASVGSGTLQVRLQDPSQRPAAERVLAQALGVSVTPGAEPVALSARLPARAAGLEEGGRAAHALTELTRAGIDVTGFALGQPSLDEVFLSLTRQPAPSQTSKEDGA